MNAPLNEEPGLPAQVGNATNGVQMIDRNQAACLTNRSAEIILVDQNGPALLLLGVRGDKTNGYAFRFVHRIEPYPDWVKELFPESKFRTVEGYNPNDYLVSSSPSSTTPYRDKNYYFGKTYEISLKQQGFCGLAYPCPYYYSLTIRDRTRTLGSVNRKRIELVHIRVDTLYLITEKGLERIRFK